MEEDQYPDRVTSRCSKWVRDYPAGSHKHWGCESTWQRLDASWSSCRSALKIMRYTDLWLCCSISACLICRALGLNKNHYECEWMLQRIVEDFLFGKNKSVLIIKGSLWHHSTVLYFIRQQLYGKHGRFYIIFQSQTITFNNCQNCLANVINEHAFKETGKAQV